MQMGIKGDGHSGERYPGSREAIRRGCSCDAVQNRYGEGQRGLSGFKLFVPDEQCPLHGFRPCSGHPAQRGRRAHLT